jgi:nicotinamide-nucleotide amidase
VKACIIAVGSELLTPLRLDTNSLHITERLNAVGYDIRFKAVAGDDVAELARLLEHALGAVDLVVSTGGLGPTADDITREAVARVFGVPLDVDESIADSIRERFSRRGLAMPAINRRQAEVPRGATVLDNPNGSAPGLYLERDGKVVVVLPGPPREMKPMLDGVIADRLRPRSAGRGVYRRVLRLTGRSESDVDAHAQPIYSRWTGQPVPITTTILAALGQVELHLTASADRQQDADAALDTAVAELVGTFASVVYSIDGRPLEAVLGGMLRDAGWTIAAAESCTGGLLMSRLTDVPGSSAYVERGVVCYSNRAKTELLGVPAALIEQHGAVSEPVAAAMAEAIRTQSGSTVGVGITGIAGPDGGTAEKPVGTVAIAVASPDALQVRTLKFFGGRDMVKFQATQTAMNMVRLLMIDASVHGG